MNRQKNRITYYILFILSITLLAACFKSLTQTSIVYENTFESGLYDSIKVSGYTNGTFGRVSDVRISNFNGTKVLGKLNSSLIQLLVEGLPTHRLLRVEFDLYIHDKWKNDLWKYSIDGADQLLTGFSNDSTVKQAYPNWLGNSSPPSAARRNAVNSELPGSCSNISSPNGTSMYRIVNTIEHTGKTVTLNCSDAGNFFNDTCQRSWSIDNLKISTFKN